MHLTRCLYEYMQCRLSGPCRPRGHGIMPPSDTLPPAYENPGSAPGPAAARSPRPGLVLVPAARGTAGRASPGSGTGPPVDGRGTAWGGGGAGRSRVGWVLKIAIATTRYVVNLGLCRGAEGASCKTNFGVQKSQIFLPLRGDSIPVIQHPEWHSSFSW